MNKRRIALGLGTTALSVVLSVTGSPVASATPADSGDSSGAVTGAGFGPTLGVGDESSYTGGSTSNNLCGSSTYAADTCAAATVGVGGASSYTGGSTVSASGGTATLGVGGVDSYTGQGIPGTAQNGTNSTTRTVNFGPGSP